MLTYVACEETNCLMVGIQPRNAHSWKYTNYKKTDHLVKFCMGFLNYPVSCIFRNIGIIPLLFLRVRQWIFSKLGSLPGNIRGIRRRKPTWTDMWLTSQWWISRYNALSSVFSVDYRVQKGLFILFWMAYKQGLLSEIVTIFVERDAYKNIRGDKFLHLH